MRSETYSTPGSVLLNLDIPAGEIAIQTADTDETRVELAPGSDSESALEIVQSARIELLKRGDGHEVVVEVPTRSGISISFSRGPDVRFGTPELRLRVTCPRGAALDIRTKSADVEARGEYGAVEVKTASGDLEIDETTGSTRIKTASGDVQIERVGDALDVQSVSGDVDAGTVRGDVRAQLVSGDVAVRDAGGSVNANTVSGDQRFEAVQNGRVQLKAISGNVTVGVRRGAQVYVDVNTVSGSTESELELGDTPGEEVPDTGRLVEILVKTVSGDVRIERAPAPVEQTDRP